MQTIEIANIISHPNYSGKYNDIALMKLKSPIKINEFARPACLATESMNWEKAIATGFGKLEYGEIKVL